MIKINFVNYLWYFGKWLKDDFIIFKWYGIKLYVVFKLNIYWNYVIYC